MGSEFGDQDLPAQWEQTQGSDGRQEKIFVSVRIRPLNEKESQSNDFADWECIDNTTILYKNCLGERSTAPNAYTFDRVFGFDSSTESVYDEAAREVALSVLNGINSSVFAYGQTSSGKTFTMGGVTQYAVADIYNYVEKHREREFVVKFSAMEIYNECVRDLLSEDPSPLRLLDDPERGTVVEKLTEEVVEDKNHLLELISVCEAQRQVGETSLNETSSRSHQILRLTIESSARQFGGGNSSMLTASVNFVDLAGSERTSQTQSTGARLKEGSHINRSLLTLGKVIRTLSKGRNAHVSYRDSKLTRILQNSLGGNARTAIICTMSPAHSHLEQSRNTLLFASCAKEVSTNAQVNVVMSDKALVKHLRKELLRLESELKNMSPVSSKADVALMLKEKEHQIEKMDKEIKELSRQRDLAQSKVEELLHSKKNNPVLQLQRDNSHYPTSESRRKLSWPDDSSLTSDSSDYQRLDADLTTSESLKYLYEHGGFDLSKQHSDLLENLDHHILSDGSSPQLLSLATPERHVSLSNDPAPRWEEVTTTKINDEEDDCKEVRCIEVIEPPRSSRKLEFRDPVKVFVPQEEVEYEKEKEQEVFEVEQTRSPSEAKTEIEKEHLRESFKEKDKVLSTTEDAEKEKESIEVEEKVSATKEVVEKEKDSFKEEEKLSATKEELESEKGSCIEEEDVSSTKEHSEIEKEKENFEAEKSMSGQEENSEKLEVIEKAEQAKTSDMKAEGESLHSDAEHDALVKRIKELHRIIDTLVNRNPVEVPLLEPEAMGSRVLSLNRSRSCKAVLTTSPISPSFEKITFHYRDQSFGGFNSEQMRSERPKGLPRDGKFSRFGLPNSIRNAIMTEMEQDKYSDVDSCSVYSSVAGTSDERSDSDKQMGYEMESVVGDDSEDARKNSRSAESIGDDASFMMQLRDCMSEGTPSTLQSPTNWNEEFESQRFKIIELWHVCHIPLVHRTYFFLLFKGDPSDKLYMEVELRRLSFIKNRFSLGQKIVMDGQLYTPSSSIKALNQEREMLLRQMYKRLPAQERASVFQKWGIPMNSKQRRLQLARKIWNDPKDMQHVRESADLVAKLVGFVDEGQVPKEMFVGPSITPKTLNRRSYSWKSGISSMA